MFKLKCKQMIPISTKIKRKLLNIPLKQHNNEKPPQPKFPNGPRNRKLIYDIKQVSNNDKTNHRYG